MNRLCPQFLSLCLDFNILKTIIQILYRILYRIIYLNVFFWCFLIAAAKSLQSCPTLCDPIDSGPPGSAVLQARILEWVAFFFSNAWKWKVKVKSLSRVRLLVIPWTAAYQAPPSMGFSRQEYWSGVPLPSSVSSFVDYNYVFFCQEYPWNVVPFSVNNMRIHYDVNLFQYW